MCLCMRFVEFIGHLIVALDALVKESKNERTYRRIKGGFGNVAAEGGGVNSCNIGI